MADYSEFPTTPTAWQEVEEASWQTVTPQETEDVAPPRRRPDRVALIPGVLFVLLAVTLMTGLELPRALVQDGVLFWLVLVGVGISLLLSEVRKVRRRG